MDIALFVIAVIWIALGALLVIYTDSTMNFLKKIFFVHNVKLLAIVPFVFGLVLLAGAFYHFDQKQMFWLIFILGVLSVLKGVYLFFGPMPQTRKLMEWWFEKASERTLRVCGLIIVLIGSAVLSYVI